MKFKLFSITAVFALLLVFLSACDAREAGSLKTFTHPYIAHYECTEGSFGGEDIMEKFEYIEIYLVNSKEMQLIYKPKNGDRKIVESEYTFDSKSHEFTADIGIYGFRFKPTTVIENGKFTISKAIGTKQLVLKFQSK